MARNIFPTAATAFALLLALGLPPALSAQTAPAATPVSPVTKAPDANASTATPPPAPKRPRAISADVAALLSQNTPKFTPPPPPPPPPTAEELARQKAEDDAPADDLRDSDKPKNGIVRLPKVVVQEQRPVIFTERQILTKKGLRDVAMRRYISDADRALNRFSLPIFSGWSLGGQGSSTEQRALTMYAEDERLRNMADLADNTNMIMRSDRAAGATAKDAAQSTFMRSSDFGYGGMKK